MAASALALPGPATAQTAGGVLSAIDGVVRDTLGHPIPFGVLGLVGTARVVRGNDSGYFHLDSVPAGREHLRLARLGFTTLDFELEVPAGSTVHVDLRLRRDETMTAFGPMKDAGVDTAARAVRQVRSRSSVKESDLATRCRSPKPGPVAGIVVDESGQPVPYASVSLEARSESPTITDRDGCFALGAPSNKDVVLLVRKIGFREHREPISAGGDSGRFVQVRVSALAVTLDGVTVTADADRQLEATGFYDRLLDRKKGVGDGWFVTPEELERRNLERPTTFIAAFPSITLRLSGISTMIPMGNGGHCIMAVYIDGARVYYPGEAMLGTMTDLSLDPDIRRRMSAVIAAAASHGIDEMLSTNNIAAIEVYPRAAQAPPRYQALNGACGVILIWTKR